MVFGGERVEVELWNGGGSSFLKTDGSSPNNGKARRTEGEKEEEINVQCGTPGKSRQTGGGR